MDAILFFVATMVGVGADPILLIAAIAAALALRTGWGAAAAAVAIGLLLDVLQATMTTSGAFPYPFGRFLLQRVAAAALVVFAVRGIRAMIRRARAI